MSYRFTSSVLCLCPLVAAFACGGDRFDEECPPGSHEVGTACVQDNAGAGTSGSAGSAGTGPKGGSAGVGGGGAAGLGGAGSAGTAGTGGAGTAGSGAAGKGGSAGGGSGAAGAGAGSASGKGGAGQGGGGSSAGSAGTSGSAGKAGGAGVGGVAGGAGGTAGAAGVAGAAGQAGGAAGASGTAGAGGDGGAGGGAGSAGDAGASGAGGDPGCQAGKTKCEGATLQTCDAGAWKDVRTCALGCAADSCIGVAALAVGGAHACAALSNGTVRCWGDSATDALGVAGLSQADVPVEVAGLSNVTHLALGASHSCARTSLNEIWCWGSNEVTQLGVTTPGLTKSAAPVSVPGVAGASSLSASNDRTCAVLTSGKVSCWGAFPSPTASLVASPADTVQISVGANHMCARDFAGDVYCWGDNTDGQSGAQPLGGTVDTPKYITNGAVNVQAGNSFSCFLRAAPESRVYCWGSDGAGTLGNGPDFTTPMAMPKPVLGLDKTSLMSVGIASVLAVEEAGATKCWGDQSDFECANAPQNGNDSVEAPSIIPDWTGKPVLLAAGRGNAFGGAMSCAAFENEQVVCWASVGVHKGTVWTVPW